MTPSGKVREFDLPGVVGEKSRNFGHSQKFSKICRLNEKKFLYS